MPRPAARRPSAFAAAAEVCEARRLLTTFVVTDSGDATDDADGALTYREALLAAEAEAGADVITFADGVEGVILEADLPELTGDLTVAGSAAGVTVDHAGFGGLTLSGGTFAFSGVRFENAARDAAAALDVSGGATLTVTGGSLGDNRATADGAGGVVRLVDSDATFTGVLIQDNAAAVRGGIAAIGDSELRLVDVTAVRNDGGVVFAAANGDGDEPAVFITGGEWGLNDAGTDPEDSEPFGNIRLDAGSLTVTGGRFSTNVGGVIRAVDANVTVTGGYFALNRGGAVSADGRTLAVADATFSTNFGGAIYSISARTTVADSLFFRNENEDRSGGAIRAAFSTVTVTDSTFRGNTAVRGGAVSADRSSLSLIETRMFGNGVASPNLSIDADEGGAVLIGEDADVTVEGGRYALNRARFFGGAFAARPGAGSLSLSNLSLNRNVAGDQAPDGSGGPVGRGGGLYAVQEVGGPLEVSITNVFAARNRAEGGGSASGGGAYLNEADLTVADSNFAGNAAGGGPAGTSRSRRRGRRSRTPSSAAARRRRAAGCSSGGTPPPAAGRPVPWCGSPAAG